MYQRPWSGQEYPRIPPLENCERKKSMKTNETLELALSALKNAKEVFAELQYAAILSGKTIEEAKLGKTLLQDKAIAAIEFKLEESRKRKENK